MPGDARETSNVTQVSSSSVPMLRPSSLFWVVGLCCSSSASGWILLLPDCKTTAPSHPQLRRVRGASSDGANRTNPWSRPLVVTPCWATAPAERTRSDDDDGGRGGNNDPLRILPATDDERSSNEEGPAASSFTSPSPQPPLFVALDHHHPPPPYLVVITDGDACDNDKRLHSTLNKLQRAVETGQVDLVLVRLNNVIGPATATDPNEEDDTDDHDIKRQQRQKSVRRRARHLIRQLVDWSEAMVGDEASGHRRFAVMWSSPLWRDNDNDDDSDDDDSKRVAVMDVAHGVHFKEAHRSWISEFRATHSLESTTGPNVQRRRPVVGTSCHSVESALQALQYDPDYLLVGTCYPTASHPEKAPDKVEGPELPGLVRRAVLQEWSSSQSTIPHNLHDNNNNNNNHHHFPHRPRPPYIVAIGGIDASNCGEPIVLGADGVAVIRAVSEADDPASAVQALRQAMQSAWQGTTRR